MSRTVLITGVSSGIGGASASLFSKAGWRVLGVSRREVKGEQALWTFIRGDVSQEDTWRAICDEIAAGTGRLDALVNNAAVQICKPLLETTPEEWDKLMAVNLRSLYLGLRYLHPFMRKRGGAIVNISSVHAVATSANIAAYAASKGAMLALTRALAIELAQERIRVNAVLPGAVDTPMLHAGLSRGHLGSGDIKRQLDELGRRTVMGRVGKPEEIAQAVLFLADEERSSFITGQTLVADGGATARLSTE